MKEENQLTYRAKFSAMADESKVWIYQSSRHLADEEVKFIEEESAKFVQSWASHGSALKAEFVVLFNLFLVFVVDESMHEASGCSIDKSVHFVKELQTKLKVDFFDRTKIVVNQPSGQLALIPLSSIKEELRLMESSYKSLIFNNLIYNYIEFKQVWLAPADTTWVARFLN